MSEFVPVPFSYREAVVRHLLALRDANDGIIPSSILRHWAVLLGCRPRTLSDWIARGGPRTGERGKFSIDSDPRWRELYFECLGNIRRIRHKALQEGLDTPSRDTLARAFRRGLTGAERGYAREGAAGFRRKITHQRYEAPYRWHTWQFDHKQLDVWVLTGRGTTPVRPWVTAAIDDKTRYVPCAVLSLRPDQATVIAALRQGIAVDPETGVGGRPEHLRWDNGAEFVARAVTHAAMALGCIVIPTSIYSPWEKGKIERFNRTLADELVDDNPGWIRRPRDRTQTPVDDTELLTLDEFRHRFDERIREYNTQRPHAALNGRTPLQAFRDDPAPIKVLGDEELRILTLPSEVRKVTQSYGVRVANHEFWAPEFDGLVGEQVEVRYMPGRYESVEIWRDGVFLCDAQPLERVSEDQRKRALQNRDALERSLREEARQAAQRANRRYPALTDLHPETAAAAEETAGPDRSPATSPDVSREPTERDNVRPMRPQAPPTLSDDPTEWAA
jgi:putative transposase